ncbi:MAG: nucleoside triphosphate pyrophosphohydrolase [Planctomycetota bacterium]
MTRPVPDPAPADDPRVVAFRHLLAVTDALRDPDGGCPWDLEQTTRSMAPYVVEEAHELVEAIEDGGPEPPGGDAVSTSAREAGDVLTSLLMVCRIAQDEGSFDAGDAARAASDKLVRRHPHVFANGGSRTPDEVLETWEEIKRAERAADGEDTSALAGIPRALPALQRAGRTCQKAVAAGFHWKVARGALAKLEEELDELREALPEDALARDARPSLEGATRAAVEHELGDVLMAAAFLGGYLSLDPEGLCRSALRRFESRFRHMEAALGGTLAGRSLDEMMAAWRGAKESEAAGGTA